MVDFYYFLTLLRRLMTYDNNNIFAKILNGDIPCIKVYEDEQTLAFMDIMPQAEGHTLVIPKEAAVTIHDLSDDAAANLIKKVKLVANAVKKGLSVDGISLFQLNGESAGQTVPHIHFHILPGSYLTAKAHASVSSETADLQVIANKIKAAF
ncbi:MAG: histidine triad (HIT) family protein [Arenicella sp.]|jgi:histidine triad (HIT) family protein